VHATRPLTVTDFATFEVKNVNGELWPGLTAFFTDASRPIGAVGATLLRACEFFARELIAELHQPLQALPICALYEYTAERVVGSRRLGARARMWRARALLAAGWVHEVWMRLMGVCCDLV
jgi:hypothetical protein